MESQRLFDISAAKEQEKTKIMLHERLLTQEEADEK